MHRQCSKPRGHGPDGLFCVKHDPARMESDRAAMIRRQEESFNKRMAPYRAMIELSGLRASLKTYRAWLVFENEDRVLRRFDELVGTLD
jgi:hypothetical protein